MNQNTIGRLQGAHALMTKLVDLVSLERRNLHENDLKEIDRLVNNLSSEFELLSEHENISNTFRNIVEDISSGFDRL